MRIQVAQLAVLLGAVTLFSLPVITSAAVDNTDNPFTNTSDDGAAKDIAVPGAVDGTNTKDAFVNVVRGVINWTLGILAFVALVVLLYGGFMMVTAAGEDDKYKKGMTILKQAAI